MIILITCMNELGYIGEDNNLLYSFEQDMKFFKEKTLGQKVVMGKNTFISMNCKPLNKRENIIISSDPFFKKETEDKYNNVRVLNIDSFELELKNNKDLDYYIIGGSQLYNKYIDKVDIIYLTHVVDSRVGNKRFPCFDINSFNKELLYIHLDKDRISNNVYTIEIIKLIKK